MGLRLPPPLPMSILNSPPDQGGRNVINIKYRNEAIYMMKLKRLFLSPPERPIAADLAVATIRACLPKRLRNLEETDPLIQDVLIQNIPGRTSLITKPLPLELKKALKIGKKYNLSLDAQLYTADMKLKMPAWYRIRTDPNSPNTDRRNQAKCLRLVHNCHCIGDLVNQASYGENPPHEPRIRNCPCTQCTHLRSQGCKNPSACYNAAERILATVPPELDPYEGSDPPPYPLNDLLDNLKKHAVNDEERIKIFHHLPLPETNLYQNMRIFSPPEQPTQDPPPPLPSTPPLDITIYTDGSCRNNGETDASAGFGLWYGPNNPKNIGLRVHPDAPQTNNIAEMPAIHHSTSSNPPNHRLHIKTDSNWCINTLCNDLQHLENTDYVYSPVGNIIRSTVSALRSRPHPTTFEWIKGHNGNVGNEGADSLAALGAAPHGNHTAPPSPSTPYCPKGAKLIALTQATALKLILHTNLPENANAGRTSAENISQTQLTIKTLTGTSPTPARIWNTILKNRSYAPPNIRSFVWKIAQNGLKIGSYWLRINGYENRGKCTECDCTESINHILFTCPLNQGNTVWSVAETLCKRKTIPWPDGMNTSHIIAAPLLKIKNQEGKTRTGASRFLTIIILECAWTIWKMRCKRVLGNAQLDDKGISITEALNNIKAALNERLCEDTYLTNTKRYAKKALNKDLVASTWSKITDTGRRSTQDCPYGSEVLVGIPDPPRPGSPTCGSLSRATSA